MSQSQGLDHAPEVRPLRFRKKPVVIEALHYEGTFPLDWLGFHDSVNKVPGEDVLEINTLEGVMRVDLGDWIIKGVKGEFYPCKPDVFEATYEPA